MTRRIAIIINAMTTITAVQNKYQAFGYAIALLFDDALLAKTYFAPRNGSNIMTYNSSPCSAAALILTLYVTTRSVIAHRHILIFGFA